jgi:hypothetical protein
VLEGSKPMIGKLFAFYVFVVTALCSLGPEGHATTVATPVAQHAIETAGNGVIEYISKSKGWKKSQYKVLYSRTENSNLVFYVDFLADHGRFERTGVLDGGESVEVYFDPVSKKVVKELHFQ